MDPIPRTYADAVLGALPPETDDTMHDPNCLDLLKHYRSLMPLAMEARKTMFHLRPADGAIGVHVAAVKCCYDDFSTLALRIAVAADIPIA